MLDWSNFYSNAITMLWPRNGGIQYPCSNMGISNKSNKLPMPHVLNTSSSIRPVQQREGSRRRKRKQRSLWKCILQKMQHCSIPREKYELWNIKCPNIQMWKLLRLSPPNMEFVKFPISKCYLSKCVNRDIFGKKLRMKDVLLISFEPFFPLYYLYSMILLTMETKHLLKLHNPSCTRVWYFTRWISPRWLIVSGI